MNFHICKPRSRFTVLDMTLNVVKNVLGNNLTGAERRFLFYNSK